MRRTSLLIILLLSFLMPLQVVAEVLFAFYCPMSMQNSGNTNLLAASNTESELAAMPCCPEAKNKISPSSSQKTNATDELGKPDSNQKPAKSSCKTFSSCHLCKTPVQLNIQSAQLMAPSAVVTRFFNSPSQVNGLFNPASIWRPPSNS